MTITHEDMTADDIMDLVHEHWGTSVSHVGKRKTGEIGFVLYDAFAVIGAYDEYGRGCWGFAIEIGGTECVSRVFGQRLSLAGTREAVRTRLAAIDSYVRLRLSNEYLDAFGHAVLNNRHLR